MLCEIKYSSFPHVYSPTANRNVCFQFSPFLFSVSDGRLPPLSDPTLNPGILNVMHQTDGSMSYLNCRSWIVMAHNGLSYRHEGAPQIVASMCPLPAFLKLHSYIDIHIYMYRFYMCYICVIYTNCLLLGTDSKANEVKWRCESLPASLDRSLNFLFVSNL